MASGPVTPAIGVSILDLIGRTPLIRLRQIEKACPGVEIYAKAEWQNPGGSVKDRAAARMIAEGELTGALTPNKTILDATSGNTGIAYAMIGAAKGYKVTLCVPENASSERKLILRAFGADLVLTSPLESTDGNWRAHYDTTGPEIIEQTAGTLTHFVAGLGTSGTFVGTARRLRQFNQSIKLISFQPATAFHGLEGLKHMESAIVPGIYDASIADEDLRVESEDAFDMVRRLAREEGIMAGISSGAAIAATLQVAST